ncbi:MAG TPA: hypothetical protein VGM25_06005 [Caulobacteraceae bacterium]|jgi:hypothetical protein
MLRTIAVCIVAAAALAGSPTSATGGGERARIDRFATGLRAERDRLGRADGDVAQAMRAAFRQGSQDSARAALAQYAGALQGLLSAAVPPPKLGGCYARARPSLVEARTLATTALNDRRMRVSALAAITYRPLTLPDFGSVMTSPAAAEKENKAIEAGLGKADMNAKTCEAEERRRALGKTP